MTKSQLYDSIGARYREFRRPDPRIRAAITRTLTGCRSVVNVGAGTGSYEPTDCFVVAVEPSETMIGQRARDAAPVVRASAMALPFPDKSFDASLALLTVHHWPDQLRGLREIARVGRRCVIFTWDPQHEGMWLTQDYFPEIIEQGGKIFWPLERYAAEFGECRIVTVPIPHDCTDGFLQAYWRRPEEYFDAGVRSAISGFALMKNVERGLSNLKRDLANGAWDSRHGHLLDRTELDIGYRLITFADPGD